MYKICEEILNELENKGQIKRLREFTFPPKQELKLRLKDMLEDQVDEKYYLSDKQVERMTTTTYVSGQPEKRIQNDVCRTLAARDWKDPKCVRIGNIYGEKKGGGFAGNVYEKEGLSPALQTMQGGNRQPMIQETRNLKEQLCDNLIEQGISTRWRNNKPFLHH